MSIKFKDTEMTGGKIFTPENLRGQWSVIYFYPKDATPGCTREGKDFRDAYAEFQTLNCEVYGVSRDKLPAHERFKEKQTFPFDLISDTDSELCNAFDVIKEKNIFGKKVLGIVRSTFLINPDGEIVREWRKVKVSGHVEEVLQAVKDEQV